MKKFIASAVAAATAFTATVPTTHAATLTPTDQNQCRVTLNDAERGPAWQAERIAKTLTHGMYAVAVAEAFEATFEGLKPLGDDHLTQPAITTAQEIRLANDEPGARPDYNAARAATKAKLAKLGLVYTDADFYLDMKEGAQIPLSPAGTSLKGSAGWYIGIDGSVPKANDLGPDYEFGRTGANTARFLNHMPDWKRSAFASNMSATYFAQAFDALESGFHYPLMQAQKCNEGTTHVIFPMQNVDLPTPPALANTLPGNPADPAPTPTDPSNPDPDTPAPERPATVDAKLAEVIGIIAAVLTALGALFALLKTAGFNVPDLPKIPGLNK
ncbi:hypothetical protein [Corynebacterium lujinxingii]|uniref:Uncharacterized protein n=1 Tax=Corynebacterium lujinxingii TaxID=2763010 RepID=A0A7H0JZL7_9CORY|nr:hypothetical protein [Corynebacterium lujinxingii]MBC3179659.1 hypothetical protein [Corynebacterium lujinxingii]NNO10352.1 hypothetical protein [Corynebacterium lujinxingii]QNP90483.1 hypothetical protein IAU68_01425 [Corynebacterium lujinxingii]